MEGRTGRIAPGRPLRPEGRDKRGKIFPLKRGLTAVCVPDIKAGADAPSSGDICEAGDGAEAKKTALIFGAMRAGEGRACPSSKDKGRVKRVLG